MKIASIWTMLDISKYSLPTSPHLTNQMLTAGKTQSTHFVPLHHFVV